jgi:gliding motility-associated-like protein
MNADTTKICSGDTVNFTASASVEIPGLVYSWYKNGSFFSNAGPVQFVSGLNNGDSVYVEVSPGAACYSPGTSRTEAIRIQVTPSGGIMAAGLEGLDTLVCSGSPALLHAVNSNQIPDVTYTWLVNGIEQLNQSSEFLSYVPQQAVDTVQVIITALSGTQCLLQAADTSLPVLVSSIAAAQVKDSLQLTAPGNGVFLCPNTPISFNLGSSLDIPYRVEWFANGVKADSLNNTSFTFNGLSGTVQIRAVVKFDTALSCLQTNGPSGIDSTEIYTLEFLPANDPRCLPCALALTAEVQNLSCATSADGKITATVSGGTGAYVFSLSPTGTVNSGSAVFSGLLPGVYMLTVRDTVTQCTDTLRNLNVVSQHNYAVSLAFENSSSCINNADGKIEVLSVADGSGDNGKYQFSLIPGYPEFSSQTLFENLLPDTFLLQVQDTISGCITSVTRVIGRKDPVDAYFRLLNGVSCHGGADGRIRVDSIIKGSGLYQLSFSGDPGSFVSVQAGDTLGGFASGDAFLYIRDIKTGCVDSNFIFVPQPAPLALGLSLEDSSSCISSTGKVKISLVSGGTAPYSYQVQFPDSSSFTNLAFPADSLINNLGGGWLLVQVTDSKSCSYLDSLEVPVDRPLIGEIALTSPCPGDTNGQIRLSGITGGTAPYTFTLIDGLGQVLATQTDSVFSGLPAGSYNIGIRDASAAAGCENIYSRQLLPTEPLHFRLVKFKESSCENFDGEAVFALSGGQRPYRFSFDSLAGQFTSFQPAGSGDTIRLRGLSARIPGDFYTLKILDNGPDGGCSYDTSFVQPGQAPLQYQFSKKDISCYGLATGSVTLSNIRGTGPLVLRVRRIGSEEVIAFDTLEGSFFQNSSFELGGIPAGDFNLEVKQFGTCSGSKSIAFSLTQPSEIVIKARMFRKSADGFKLGGILLDSIRGGTQPYLLTFNGGAAFAYKADTLFRNLNPGVYALRVKDFSDCFTEKEIVCEEDEVLFVPNLFTPNGDGFNDRLEIRNLPSGSRLLVKDRWGKEVFRSEDYQNDWAASDQEAGTYFWLLEIPNQESRSGWINIER